MVFETNGPELGAFAPFILSPEDNPVLLVHFARIAMTLFGWNQKWKAGLVQLKGGHDAQVSVGAALYFQSEFHSGITFHGFRIWSNCSKTMAVKSNGEFRIFLNSLF